MEDYKSDLVFLPLGGCGEIGMNLNLIGHEGRWLAIDCGITLKHQLGSLRPSVQMPDPSFIQNRRNSLEGLLVTHAHEDHLGAIPYLGLDSNARFTLHPLLQQCCDTKHKHEEECYPNH